MSNANNLNAQTRNREVVESNRPVVASCNNGNPDLTLAKERDYNLQCSADGQTNLLKLPQQYNAVNMTSYYWVANNAGNSEVVISCVNDAGANVANGLFYANGNYTTITIVDNGGNGDGLITINSSGVGTYWVSVSAHNATQTITPA